MREFSLLNTKHNLESCQACWEMALHTGRSTSVASSLDMNQESFVESYETSCVKDTYHLPHGWDLRWGYLSSALVVSLQRYPPFKVHSSYGYLHIPSCPLLWTQGLSRGRGMTECLGLVGSRTTLYGRLHSFIHSEYSETTWKNLAVPLSIEMGGSALAWSGWSRR